MCASIISDVENPALDRVPGETNSSEVNFQPSREDVPLGPVSVSPDAEGRG